jgi:hypothetical protein
MLSKSYSIAFKLQAIQLLKDDHQTLRTGALSRVAKSLSISPSILFKWNQSEHILSHYHNPTKHRLSKYNSQSMHGGRKKDKELTINQVPNTHSVVIGMDGRPCIVKPHLKMLRCVFVDEEFELFKWIVSRRNRGLHVSRKEAQLHMINLVRHPLRVLADVALSVRGGSDRSKFCATSSWLDG